MRKPLTAAAAASASAAAPAASSTGALPKGTSRSNNDGGLGGGGGGASATVGGGGKTVFEQMVARMPSLGPEALLLPHRVWKVKFVGKESTLRGTNVSDVLVRLIFGSFDTPPPYQCHIHATDQYCTNVRYLHLSQTPPSSPQCGHHF